MKISKQQLEQAIEFSYLKGFDDAQIRTRDAKPRTKEQAINDIICSAYDQLNDLGQIGEKHES